MCACFIGEKNETLVRALRNNADMHVSIYTAREDISHGATPGDPHPPSDRPGEEWVDVSTWPGVCQAKNSRLVQNNAKGANISGPFAGLSFVSHLKADNAF